MPAKVWRDNKFSSTECWVSGNDGRGLCQVCCLVRFTTYRGEPPLKACEKINRGWRVQSNSSFEIVIETAVLCLPVPFSALLHDLAHQRGRFIFADQFSELFMTLLDV